METANVISSSTTKNEWESVTTTNPSFMRQPVWKRWLRVRFIIQEFKKHKECQTRPIVRGPGDQRSLLFEECILLFVLLQLRHCVFRFVPQKPPLPAEDIEGKAAVVFRERNFWCCLYQLQAVSRASPKTPSTVNWMHSCRLPPVVWKGKWEATYSRNSRLGSWISHSIKIIRNGYSMEFT